MDVLLFNPVDSNDHGDHCDVDNVVVVFGDSGGKDEDDGGS